MTKYKIQDFFVAGIAAVNAILFFDIILSICKIFEFRDAISNKWEFILVICIYMGVGASVIVTAIGVKHNLKPSTSKFDARYLYLIICISIFFYALHLSTNQEWVSTALNNKLASLVICLAISLSIIPWVGKK